MKIVAFVGMPGSGKSVAGVVAKKLGYHVLRLGDLTDEELKKRGLERNEKNERMIREELRKNFGMDVYAQKVSEKVEQNFAEEKLVVLDGVRSFEEYKFLKNKHGNDFVAICLAVSPQKRHERLGKRKERSLTEEECLSRDESELKNLNVGATIAMADVFILNEKDGKAEFQAEVETFLRKIGQKKV